MRTCEFRDCTTGVWSTKTMRCMRHSATAFPTPVLRKPQKPLRDKAARNSKQLPAPTPKQRKIAWERQDQLCPPCGIWLPLEYAHAHHRVPRTDPACTNEPVNLIICHPFCHLAIGGRLSIHGGITDAERMGWILRQGQDPALFPVSFRERVSP